MNQPELEKEKQGSEDQPFSELPVDSRATGEISAPESPPPAKKAESRLGRFFRIALRWVIGFIIVFLLGVLAMEFVFYRPLAQQLDQVIGERDQAQQRVKNLQGQIDSLTPLSNKNQILQDQLKESELHIYILSAEANVNSALVSLQNSKPADARLVLNKTSATLGTLQKMLPTDQQKVVTDMQNRLNLALGELESNKFAAQSDLTVLATSLLQLENTFFANP